MKRSSWKLPFITPLVYSKCVKKKKDVILNKVKRNLLITRAIIGRKISVHNGLWSKRQVFTNVSLGRKVGEFTFTRRLDINLHATKKQRKRINKKK